MPTSNNPSPQKEHINLKFEDAINQLDEIVSKMEHTEVDLDSMIKNYQSGISLLKHCQKKIEEAEFKLNEVSSDKVDSDHN
ncbi:exodeoxyribonuclease VII small subunit [Opitutales bacterium]|nr:exodeoxyribonuclease VII small subunit [Opitutales bacterium]MDA8990934.1 exodeoxyribonuclease VII small subunit [Opitutales bacterium]